MNLPNMERYLRGTLLGPGPRLTKKVFTRPLSHKGWETMPYRVLWYYKPLTPWWLVPAVSVSEGRPTATRESNPAEDFTQAAQTLRQQFMTDTRNPRTPTFYATFVYFHRILLHPQASFALGNTILHIHKILVNPYYTNTQRWGRGGGAYANCQWKNALSETWCPPVRIDLSWGYRQIRKYLAELIHDLCYSPNTGLFEMIVGVLTTVTSFSRCNPMWFLSMGLRQGSGLCSSSSRKYPGTEGTNQNRHW